MYTINSSSLIPVSSLWCHHTPGGFSRPATAVGRGLPYISYMLAAVVEHCLSGASYAEQSQISACMKFGNEACFVNGAYIYFRLTINIANYFSSRISLISSASSLYFPVTYP